MKPISNLHIAYYALAISLTMVSIWLFADIIAPFALGAIIAYLCDPLADKLETFGIYRIVTALGLSLLFVLIIVVSLIFLLPAILDQANQILKMMPEIIDTISIFILEILGPKNVLNIREISIEKFNTNFSELSPILVKSLFNSSAAAFDFFILIIIAPIVSVYLLIDWDNIVKNLEKIVPIRFKLVISELVLDMHKMVAAFARGQMLVCLLLAIFYAVALSLLGLNYGLLIGLLSGLVSFIPMVGALIGGLLALFISVFQFWDSPTWIAVIMAVFLFGQVLEGHLLTPRLVGRSVKLHPLWVIFSIGLFGSSFGWVGVMIAVPLAACLAVLIRFLLKVYFESDFYKS